LRIVGYLKRYPDVPLVFTKSTMEEGEELKVLGVSDSSFGDVIPDRTSTYGFFVLLCGMVVAWKSRATPTVATSTAEAEYVAMGEALKEVLHIRSILESLGLPQGKVSTIETDSNGAKGMAEYPQVTERSKHIDVRYHFIRHQIQIEKKIELRKVGTADMVADIFTKNIGPQVLERLLQALRNKQV
jgi:hypothetical protein